MSPTSSEVWGALFLRKVFMGEHTFLVKFVGSYYTLGKMIRSCHGRKERFKNLFPSISSEHCKSKNFPQPWWKTHLKINSNQCIQLWKDLSLRLMAKRFQRLSQVHFPSCCPWPGVLTFNTTNSELNLKSIFCTLRLWCTMPVIIIFFQKQIYTKVQSTTITEVNKYL